MAVSVASPGGGHLSYPFVNKTDNTVANVGNVWACWVRWPMSGMDGNATYVIMGVDNNADGDASDSRETYLDIGGDNVGRGTGQKRPRFQSRGTSGGNLFATNTMGSVAMPEMMARGVGYLLLNGFTYVGGVWKAWMACCPADGSPAFRVDTVAPVSNFLTSTIRALEKIYGIAPHPTAGFDVEHVALLNCNFPWDGANDRPNLAIIEGLADGTYEYDSAEVLNGGSILDWRKLASASDLEDYGPVNRVDLTVTGAVNSGPPIAPWGDPDFVSIANRESNWIFGGNGAFTQTFRGAYGGSVDDLEFRIFSLETGDAVAGFDWQDADADLAAGAWEFTLPGTGLPVGKRYRLDIRWTGTPGITASSIGEFHVGIRIGLVGQSQMVRVAGYNNSADALPTGLVGSYLGLSSMAAGTSGAFDMPTVDYFKFNSAGSGALAKLMARWAEISPECPIMVVNMAIAGKSMQNWVDNEAHGGWTLFGDGESMPLPGDSNDSGAQTMLGLAAERYVDAFVWMWGTSDIGGGVGPSGWAAMHDNLLVKLDDLYNARASYVTPVLMLPHPRSNDGGNTYAMRKVQIDKALTGGRWDLLTQFNDWAMDEDGSPHQRVPSPTDGNKAEVAGEGVGLSGHITGQALAAWFRDNRINRFGPRLLKACWTNGGRTAIEIETGRVLTVLDSSSIAAQFYVSTDSGANFSNTGFSVAFSGTKAILTKDSGAWPASNVRVDYLRSGPWLNTFAGDGVNTAEDQFVLDAKGLAYGGEAFRSGRPMHMDSVGGTGIAVAAKSGAGPRLALSQKARPGIFEQAVRMWPSGTVGVGEYVEKVIEFEVTG